MQSKHTRKLWAQQMMSPLQDITSDSKEKEGHLLINYYMWISLPKIDNFKDVGFMWKRCIFVIIEEEDEESYSHRRYQSFVGRPCLLQAL